MFTAKTRTVEESGADELLPTGHLLLVRLLPLGGTLPLAPGIAGMPANTKKGLLEFVQPRFRAWQQARYGVEWNDFLNEASYLLNHFLIRDMEPIKPPATRQPEMTPVQAARSIARRMQTEIITTSLDVHYARWLNKPIPEWGGKTPREMVQAPEGTEMVEVLLDMLKDIETERARSGQPAYDVNLLRRKLGLAGGIRTERRIILPS